MAKSKTFFENVDPKFDFVEAEKKLLAEWYKTGIVKKYLAKNKNSTKFFSFLDGPITANNPMGVHHAWGRTYKDLWQKYKNMQGFRERFQNGFDAQGLWVEVEVEKELGFKNKKDIESFGVAKFVQLCRDRVKKYSEIQTDQSKRLGYFMDWDNSYYTLSDDNNYMIWHFLKVCFENGWVYKGNDVVPWCPRCETAISEHEILTEDYKDVTHESVFLTFPIVGLEDEFLLAWTTTPWTVPANIALAVEASLEYSQVEVNKKRYWLAKETILRTFGEAKVKVLKTVFGSKLVGLRYTGAFDNLPAVVGSAAKNDKFHTVVATDSFIMPITTDEGTGIVHTSTGTGAEDHKLGKKIGLPVVPAIDDQANYLAGFDFLTGKNAKKNPALVLDYLKEFEGGKFILKTMNYRHRYPACWRCKTELVWKVTDEWYIAMDRPTKNLKLKIENIKPERWKDGDEEPATRDTRTLRERMKTVAGKINWTPAFGKDREIDWLTNMHDWLISKKNRYWGLALPIWECKKCGNFEVIGSKDELKEKAVEGWKEFQGKTPHKPQIDAVKIKCSKCGSVVSRVEPVGNPWLDAGIVPFSTISDGNLAANFTDAKTKPLYTTDMEKFNSWFPVDFITESFPGQFKNWFYSLIAMSTVLEDEIPFKSVLGYATLFDEHGKPMHKSSGNAIEFSEGADKIGADVMRWMYARQNPADNMLFGYTIANDTRRRFHLKLWNVYNFFVTYANLDGWKPSKESSVKRKASGSNILDAWIILRLNQTTDSVTRSLEKYDSFTASAGIEKFVDDFSIWYIRRSRDRVGPAAESETDKEAFYETTYKVLVTLLKLLAPFMPFMPEIIYRNLTKEVSVHLADWPLAEKALTEKEIKILTEMEIVRQIVEKAHAERKEMAIAVKQPLQKLQISNYILQTKSMEKLLLDELNIKEVEYKSGKGEIEVVLDTRITPELLEEAKVRDVVRKIQEERKNLGLNLTQKINVTLEEIPLDIKIVQWMTRKTQIAGLKTGKFKVEKVME